MMLFALVFVCATVRFEDSLSGYEPENLQKNRPDCAVC